MSTRELSKFFCGFAASQLVTHGGLALSGARFQMLGMDYDPGLNTAAAAFWAIASVLLYLFAWGRPTRRAL